jgi:potassium-transporting ATPase potassium-binding subunit
MTVTGWVQIAVLVAVLTILTPLLGGYMARVYQGERVALTAVIGPLEGFVYGCSASTERRSRRGRRTRARC